MPEYFFTTIVVVMSAEFSLRFFKYGINTIIMRTTNIRNSIDLKPLSGGCMFLRSFFVAWLLLLVV